MSHTPGPWKVDDDEIVTADGVVHIVCFGHNYDDYGAIGARYIVAEEDYDRARYDAESKANAHLIAAAPELLALAVLVAEHFQDTDAPLGHMARTAIAKAEGR